MFWSLFPPFFSVWQRCRRRIHWKARVSFSFLFSRRSLIADAAFVLRVCVCGSFSFLIFFFVIIWFRRWWSDLLIGRMPLNSTTTTTMSSSSSILPAGTKPINRLLNPAIQMMISRSAFVFFCLSVFLKGKEGDGVDLHSNRICSGTILMKERKKRCAIELQHPFPESIP